MVGVKSISAAAIALGIVALAASVGVSRLQAHPAGGPPAPAPIISGGSFPGSLAAPTPAPVGMRVKVPDLGIDLPVVEGDGTNVALYEAALYPTLKVPGGGGRSLIYAHARAGMFGPLFHAKVGQRIEVARGGRPLRYVITQYYPRWPSTDLRLLAPADHEELILLTCTTYNLNDPRIVVIAEPA
jgi:LPXTG-site transpeptidase (sortase) family protein